MKWIFAILLLIHALIHFLGFAKSLSFFDLKDFPVNISKPMGFLWLAAFLILLSTSAFYIIKNPIWWLFGIAGLIISQGLIFSQWSEAKFGTIPNIILLLVALVAVFQFRFENQIDKEIDEMLERSTNTKKIIQLEDIQDLPDPVQRWLQFTGVIGKETIQSVYMEQSYKIKLKPEQTKWFDASAAQVSTTSPPAFVWTVDMKIMPMLFAFGRDKFSNGQGEMLIKLLSIFPIAKDGPNLQIDESAIQRYIGELVWYPSAALLDFYSWQQLGENTVQVTLEMNGKMGSGIFEFDGTGKLLKFSALRYMGSGPDAVKKEWFVRPLTFQEFEGILIPSKCTATWVLDEGDWTWAEIQIDSVNFNRD